MYIHNIKYPVNTNRSERRDRNQYNNSKCFMKRLSFHEKRPSNTGTHEPENDTEKFNLSVYKVLIENLPTESFSWRRQGEMNACIVHPSDHLLHIPPRNGPGILRRMQER